MNRTNRILQMLAVTGASLLLGFAVATTRLEVVIAVAAVLTVVGVVARPEIGLYAYLIVFFVLDRTVDMGLLPQSARWLPDVVLAVLLARMLIEWMVGRRRPRLIQPVAWTIGVLFVVVTLSSIANGYGLLSWIVGVRYYLRYPLLFIALTNTPLPLKTRRRLLVLLGVVFVAQLPLTVLQFASSGRPADVNSGSFAMYGGVDLLFFCLAVMAVLLVHYLSSDKHPLWALVGALSAVVPPLLGGTRVVLFLAPVVMLLALVRGVSFRGARGWGRLLVVGSALTLAAVALTQSVWYASAVAPNIFRSFADVRAYEMSSDSYQIGRLAALGYTSSAVSQDVDTMLLGYGPGSLSENQFAFGRAWAMFRTGLSRSQLNASMLEIGYAGLAALALCLAGLSLSVRRISAAQDDPLWASVRGAMPVLLVTYALLLVYATVWTMNVPPLLLWVGAASLVAGEDAELARRADAPELEAEVRSA